MRWKNTIGRLRTISKLIGALRKHPLITFLVNNKGNSKALILMEPLWGVPFNLIAPFTTLYMYEQGVDDVRIGLILSLSMIVKVLFSISGGIVTDKLGRKTTLVLSDFFGWVVACLVWAFSRNFWMFLVAALINSFDQISQTSWQCLLIEDSREKDMLDIYTWLTIGGLVSVFVAPVSGVLIARFTLVPVISAVYLCFSASMLVKCFLTYRYTNETKQGGARTMETKTKSAGRMIYEYKTLIPVLLKNHPALKAMAINIILYVTNMVSGSFFSLYVTTRLGVAERYLAVFPILRAMVMLLFMFAAQHRLRRVRHKTLIRIGLITYVACHAFLILIPHGGVFLVSLYIILEAAAGALVIPRKDALLAVSVDPRERARIMALMTSFMIAFSSPFGYMSGLLSSVDRRLPFTLTCLLFLLAFVVSGRIKDNGAYGT